MKRNESEISSVKKTSLEENQRDQARLRKTVSAEHGEYMQWKQIRWTSMQVSLTTEKDSDPPCFHPASAQGHRHPGKCH